MLSAAGVPMGVVSNASGQIEEVLRRSGICQAGEGPGVSMRVVVDSHVVGVAKPDPRIFDFALPHFAEFDRERILYVGDSVTMDIVSGRGAGVYPVVVDPFDERQPVGVGGDARIGQQPAGQRRLHALENRSFFIARRNQNRDARRRLVLVRPARKIDAEQR